MTLAFKKVTVLSVYTCIISMKKACSSCKFSFHVMDILVTNEALRLILLHTLHQYSVCKGCVASTTSVHGRSITCF